MGRVKKNCIFFVLIFVTSLLIGFFATENIVIPAQASAVKIHGYSDDFNVDVLKDEWINYGSEINAPYNAMRFNGGYYWEGGVVVNKRVLDKKDVTVSVDVRAETLGSWFGLGFGGADTSTNFFGYDGALIFSTADVTYFKNYGATGLSNSGESVATNVFNDALTNVLRIEYKFDYDEVSEFYSINLSVNKVLFTDYDYSLKSADFSEAVFSTSFENIEINYQYICFNSMEHVVDVLKVDIKDTDGSVFLDDFSTSSISYPNDALGEENWHVNKSYDSDDLYIAPIGNVSLKGNDFILYTENVLRMAEHIDKLFTIETEFRINALTGGSAFGFGLALQEDSSNISATNMVGIKEIGGSYRLGLIRNGILIESSDLELGLKTDVSYTLTLSAFADNRVEICVNGKIAIFETVDTNGLVGVGTIGQDGSADVYADNFSYEYYVFKHSDAKDMSINFKGIKEDDDGILYYVNEKDWYLGSGVSLPMYNIYFRADKLVFSNSTDNSSFGPKHKYGEFMFQFNVTVTSGEKNGAAFGLAFGKSSYSSNLLLTKAVGFMCNGYEKINPTDEENTVQTTVQGINVTTENGQTFTHISEDGNHVNMWDGRTYNICFIVKNRTVKVYFKEESQPMEMLSVCRATYTDVDTYGYPSVFGYNGISFELTQVKVTNLGLI